MSHQNNELHQSKSDIVFMVILAVWMTIIYCERVITDIMIFYNYNLIETLTKRVEAYFCFISGCFLLIIAMNTIKSWAERVSTWFDARIKSILKLTIQKLISFVVILLIFLYYGTKKKVDFYHIILGFIKNYETEIILIIVFAIFAFFAVLIIKVWGKGESNPIGSIIKEFILGIPFTFLWWCIYYFIVYGVSLKSQMTDYAYNGGLIKDSIFYTVIAIFVNGLYKFKLTFLKLCIKKRSEIITYLATVALIVGIFSLYLDLKYNEKVSCIYQKYKQENLTDPLSYQIFKEYPEKRDLELVSKHIFRRDFLIIIPLIIIIFSWLIWSAYSVPYQNEIKEI